MAAGLLALHAASQAAPGISCGNPLTVTLDIGHTPERPGAISARGKTEYAFNRALALDLAESLQAHKAKVHILNEVGSEISLGRRAGRLGAVTDGIVLSLHHDSVQPQYLERQVVEGKVTQFTRYPKARGYSLFVSGRSPAFAASERLAFAIGTELRQAGFTPSMHHAEPIKGEGRPILDAKLGVFRYDALMVLKGARVPAVLFEAGVIANPEEELELESAARKARVVAALVNGISDFCRQAP
jgi:N-acetylmuramoyl-L-alanine amidase